MRAVRDLVTGDIAGRAVIPRERQRRSFNVSSEAKDPKSEDLTAWVLFFVANALNLLAIRRWSVALASFPVYMAFITLLLVAVILLRRIRGS